MSEESSAKHVYGFVGWIISFVFFGIYSLWILCPDSTLRYYGVSYYPNKYWAFACPLFLFSCMWLIVLYHNAIIMMKTPNLDSPTLIRDGTTASVKRKSHFGPFSATGAGLRPIARDMYIGDVNILQFD